MYEQKSRRAFSRGNGEPVPNPFVCKRKALLQFGRYRCAALAVALLLGLWLAEPRVSEGSNALGSLSNLSTRGQVGSGDSVLIAGFIIEGAPATVLLRALGPSLVERGIEDSLLDPSLELFRDGQRMTLCLDWADCPGAAQIQESELRPQPREAAIQVRLEPGSYTAVLRGQDEGRGTALVEVFHAGGAGRLHNLSTRGHVGAGADALIAGFILRDGAATLVARALGPSLAERGVAAVLDAPMLRVVAEGERKAAVTRWRLAAEHALLEQLGYAPARDSEPAWLATLDQGAYTLVVEPAEEASRDSGVGLVELFEISAHVGARVGFERIGESVATSGDRLYSFEDEVYLIGGYCDWQAGTAPIRMACQGQLEHPRGASHSEQPVQIDPLLVFTDTMPVDLAFDRRRAWLLLRHGSDMAVTPKMEIRVLDRELLRLADGSGPHDLGSMTLATIPSTATALERVGEHWLYAIDQGGGLQVFDLRAHQPRLVTTLGEDWIPSAERLELRGRKLFLLGSMHESGAAIVFEVSVPDQPKPIARANSLKDLEWTRGSYYGLGAQLCFQSGGGFPPSSTWFECGYSIARMLPGSRQNETLPPTLETEAFHGGGTTRAIRMRLIDRRFFVGGHRIEVFEPGLNKRLGLSDSFEAEVFEILDRGSNRIWVLTTVTNGHRPSSQIRVLRYFSHP